MIDSYTDDRRRSCAPIRILVVDDSPRIRRGLIGLLELAEDMAVIAEAADAEQALSLVHRHAPDVVLLDLVMPGMGGLEGIRRIRAEYPPIVVIAVTAMPGGREMAALAGAHAVVTKDADPQTLLATVRSLAEPVALGP
jgi:DNA-binding NarL/FixJ family response regulator